MASVCVGQNKSAFKEADSLFANEKYKEAERLYETQVADGYASPSMLLKLAYVSDAREDYTEALYYLDLYFKKSGDRLALGKIAEIAQERNLSGYQYTDVDYLFALYKKQESYFFMALLLLLFLLGLYMYQKIRRQEEKPQAALVVQCFTAVLFIFLLNFNPPQQAIITGPSLLKSGPSAGAPSVRVIEEGHKVTVTDYSQVWSKIVWEEGEVYIRSSHLKMI